jgi:hypothetical protein
VKTATAAAFYTTPEEPEIHSSVIDYIATSVAILRALRKKSRPSSVEPHERVDGEGQRH